MVALRRNIVSGETKFSEQTQPLSRRSFHSPINRDGTGEGNVCSPGDLAWGRDRGSMPSPAVQELQWARGGDNGVLGALSGRGAAAGQGLPSPRLGLGLSAQ